MSKYNNNALAPPSVSVNLPVVNVVGLSPLSVIGSATPAVSVCSIQTSTLTSISQGIIQAPPRLSDSCSHLTLLDHNLRKVKIVNRNKKNETIL